MFNKYPYTDFHELNLDWFLAEFKDLYDAWVSFKGDVETSLEDMVQDIDDFKEFVTTYLDNLDYVQAIDDYIDELISNGTFVTVLTPVISSEVTDWLYDNVNPVGSAVVVDSSLTIAGAAADAQVTGDGIGRALKSINLSLTTSNVPSPYPDLTSFDNGSMVLVTKGASALLTDSPWDDTAYYLMTGKIGTANTTSMFFQLAFPYLSDNTDTLKELAYRTYNQYNSTYNNWQFLANDDDIARCLKSINLTLTTNNVPSPYPDLTSFDNGSMVLVTQGASSLLTDSPFNNIPYYVMTGKIGGAGSTSMFFQIAFPYGINYKHIMAVRVYDYTNSQYLAWQYHTAPLTAPTGTNTQHVRINDALNYSQSGVVTLQEGDYYITGNINIPNGKTLQGVGKGTRIIFATSNATININSGCTLQNISLVGNNDVPITPSLSPVTTDCGVSFVSNSVEQSIIQNCWIENFTSGIILYSTTQSVAHNLLISNCFIKKCHRGIYIKANSEYHKIVNCVVTSCGYGMLSRGGNNNITNCGFDLNIVGIQIDEDEGTNSGHGIIANCSLNHSDNNTGYGLIVKGTSGRMLVTGCNFYYSKILLDTTDGNIINGCGFSSMNVEIEHGNCNIITGCLAKGGVTIDITDNTVTKISECYYRNGNTIIVNTN